MASTGLARRLGATFLFAGWSDADRERLAGACSFRRAAKGLVLFHQGSPCHTLYLLTAGQVHMLRASVGGQEVVLHAIHAGGLVGCAALFLGKRYPATARVASPSAELIEIDGREFLRLLNARPDLSRQMIGALAGRLAQLADRLESQRLVPSELRVARWLAEHPAAQEGAPAADPVVRLAATKRALAQELGMTPETLSRALGKLARRGAIRVAGGSVRILDPAVLRACTGT